LAKAGAPTSLGSNKTEFTVTVGPLKSGPDRVTEFLKAAPTWGAAADGAVAGGLLAHAALSIDPHVLNAIEFSTAQELHGLPSIASYIQDHFFSAPIQSADGWFERLTGYVAEQKAAAYFEAMGKHVEFAHVANQPVWDMLVDGHPVQIKQGLAGAKDFIAHHPGFDVFTGTDVAAAIKDPAVHGLEVLNKDGIHAAADNALDNIDGAVSPGFHVPFFTLAFSSWREAKLLWNEKTTFDRAIAHVGLDVAAVGAGAWAGAKAGAIGLGLLGPVGGAVGGFFGAIVGAVGGKMVSTKVRHARFNAAKDDYNIAVAQAESSVKGEISESQRRVKELQEAYQQRFLEERNAIEEDARNKISLLRAKFENDLCGFCERFPHFMHELKRKLQVERQQVLLRTPASGFLGYLFPQEADLYRQVVNQWFKRAIKLIDEELKLFAKIEVRKVDTLHKEIQRFLKEYTFELESMANELTRLDVDLSAARSESTRYRDKAVEETEAVRSGLIREFGRQIEVIHERIVIEIRRWNSIIEMRRSVLKCEARAIGINL
jgi:hypothetical protein